VAENVEITGTAHAVVTTALRRKRLRSMLSVRRDGDSPLVFFNFSLIGNMINRSFRFCNPPLDKVGPLCGRAVHHLGRMRLPAQAHNHLQARTAETRGRVKVRSSPRHRVGIRKTLQPRRLSWVEAGKEKPAGRDHCARCGLEG